MSADLVLRPSCEACGATTDLYGIECKHMTLCLSCGKNAAGSRSRCRLCGALIAKLIREYNVRASSNTDKNFFIGRFISGLPPFSKKKSAENKWSLHKEGLQGRQVTEILREKYKNKPWNLEDETGQYQFQGHLEGSQSTTATYYLLMMHGKEFHAFPAGSWYNFSKKAQYKQLTLEEAEEMLSKRKNNATGYERWMMKAAANGANAFPEMKKNDPMGTSMAEGSRLKKGKNRDDGENSDKGEEDEDDEDRKARLGLNKKGIEDDEDGNKGGDIDLDDDDIEKGDDWEHEEVFTDDDEAVGNDDGPDLEPEVPAPPEIKQDEDDEEEENEEGGLSKSGKELKKLLGRSAGLNESEGEDDEDEEEDDDTSPVLAPKKKESSKDEPAENVSSKAATTSASRSTPGTSKASKSKRKAVADDKKHANGTSAKKPKVESSSIKDETSSLAKPSETPRTGSTPSAASKTGSTPNTSAVTEDEIRAVLLSSTPVTTQGLVSNFKERLRTPEDKKAFADTLRKISKIQKSNTHSYVVLREK